ncbi:MAG: YicC family protein [Candidatus Omnitrophica bacterium]|nr:YicC family protein [Candidatus Omnitrophota bacterium]
MIYSMTGFGKAVCKSKYGIVTVEIRALNHKFFELSAKFPNGPTEFEDKLKKIIHKSIRRGKVYLNIELNGQKGKGPKVAIDGEMARHYNQQIKKVKKALGLKGDIRLDQLIMLPGVISSDALKVDSQRLLSCVRSALKKALEELIKDKEKEGRALHKDLSRRIKNINTGVRHIRERSAVSIVRYKDHLMKTIKELAGTKNVDKGRLAQEVALFAKNCDISEELTRLKSHLSGFNDCLRLDVEVGKKLDFIAQELHREANTIASKSSDFKISKSVIHIKSEIEKIREQVKNVE